MARAERNDELVLVAYYDAAEKARVELITKDIMAGLSDDSDDSEEFDFKKDNAEERSSKSSHANFSKTTIMKGHIEVLINTNYISDTSIVSLGGEDTTPLPDKNEVMVFQSFVKARLQFPLHKMVVEVLKKLIYTFINRPLMP